MLKLAPTFYNKNYLIKLYLLRESYVNKVEDYMVKSDLLIFSWENSFK